MAYLSRRPRTVVSGPEGTRTIPGRSTPAERAPSPSPAAPAVPAVPEPAPHEPPEPVVEAMPAPQDEPDPEAQEESHPRPVRERPDEVRRWRNHTRGEALLAVILGVVALLTPMWGGAQASAELSALVTGVFIVVVAIVVFIAAWLEWAAVVRITGILLAVAGLWLLVAPVFVRQDIIYFITHVVVGLLLLAGGGEMIVGAGRIRDLREQTQTAQPAERRARAA